MMKMKLSILIMVLLSLSLMGCQNTVSGFGKDMQRTGQEIQKSANQ